MIGHTSKHLEKVQSAILCPHIKSVDIMAGKVSCGQCVGLCKQEITCNSITDLYGHMYYVLSTNVSSFGTIIEFESDSDQLLRRIKQDIRSNWTRLISRFDASVNHLDKDVLPKLRELLTRCESNEEVLVCLMYCLVELDRMFGDIVRIKKSVYGSQMLFKFPHGAVILRSNSSVATLVEEEFDEYILAPNTDYSLRTLCRNVVVDLDVAASDIDVLYSNLPAQVYDRLKSTNFEDIKIGFITGSLTTGDYIFDTHHERKDGVHFSVKDIIKSNHVTRTMSEFKKMLDKNCNLIILPELFTPENLQESMISCLKMSRTTEILITGSFHIHDESYIRNRGQVAFWDGQPVPINKMKRYIAKAHPKSEIEAFKEQDGIEHIAFSKRILNIFDSPYGRMAVLICIDFLDDDVERLLIHHGVDIVIIMAWTSQPAEGHFKDTMHRVGERTNAAVIICNNRVNKPRDCSVVIYLPRVRKKFRSKKAILDITLSEVVEKMK